jgi:hypothetical protein
MEGLMMLALVTFIAVITVLLLLAVYVSFVKLQADVKAAVSKVEALVTPCFSPNRSAATAPVTASGIVATIKAELKQYL